MGDNDISRQFEGGAGQRDVELRASVIYGFSRSTEQYSGTARLQSTSPAYRVDLQLLTLIAQAEHRTGAALGLVLPWGAILRRDRLPGGSPTAVQETYDVGPGDLELRARQDITKLLGLKGRFVPRLVVSAGTALPTGPYIPKTSVLAPGEVASAQPDKYASLGRGVVWLLADAELFGALGDQLGWYAAFYTRTALHEAENGFDWGPERRSSLGIAWRFWPGVLSASLGADWQWRGLSSELVYDPLVGRKVRATFISGGGDWVDVLPSLRAELPAGLAATLTARIPVFRDVEGVQGVQGVGLFAGVQYAFGLGDRGQQPTAPALRPMEPGDAPPGPAVASLLAPGRFTLVDYWATWCAPCQQLSPRIDEFAKQNKHVAVAKLDVSDWDAPAMQRYLPGLPGIPVIDLWSPQGRLVRRWVGAECGGFAEAALALPGVASRTADSP